MLILFVLCMRKTQREDILISVFAGGPRNDSGSDLPGALDCWTDGFDDGANNSFDDDRDKECKNIDDQYSKGFEAGNRLCNDFNMHSSVVKSDCENAKQQKQVNCDENPDHPYCNGKRGQDGLIFCSLKPEGVSISCYDDLDFDEEDDPLIHCATDPETKEECELTDSQKETFQDIFRN